jgi:hypothetical protein
MNVNDGFKLSRGCTMTETANTQKSMTVSTVYCVNTNHAYVYELLNGEIVSFKKVAVGA